MEVQIEENGNSKVKYLNILLKYSTWLYCTWHKEFHFPNIDSSPWFLIIGICREKAISCDRKLVLFTTYRTADMYTDSLLYAFYDIDHWCVYALYIHLLSWHKLLRTSVLSYSPSLFFNFNLRVQFCCPRFWTVCPFLCKAWVHILGQQSWFWDQMYWARREKHLISCRNTLSSVGMFDISSSKSPKS